MIIYYHCTRDSALLLSFLLTCHPYIPFHFMKWFLYLYILWSQTRSNTMLHIIIITMFVLTL